MYPTATGNSCVFDPYWHCLLASASNFMRPTLLPQMLRALSQSFKLRLSRQIGVWTTLVDVKRLSPARQISPAESEGPICGRVGSLWLSDRSGGLPQHQTRYHVSCPTTMVCQYDPLRSRFSSPTCSIRTDDATMFCASGTMKWFLICPRILRR